MVRREGIEPPLFGLKDRFISILVSGAFSLLHLEL